MIIDIIGNRRCGIFRYLFHLAEPLPLGWEWLWARENTRDVRILRPLDPRSLCFACFYLALPLSFLFLLLLAIAFPLAFQKSCLS